MLSKIEGYTLEAGQMLLDDFKNPKLKIYTKEDVSPVTEADYKVSDFFIQKLAPLGYPVVTEESVPKDFNAEEYFLIDPLDGTRYFIDGNKNFAVLVAFISHKRPITGVIHFPALDITFTAQKGAGSYLNGEKIYNQQTREELIVFSSGFHRREQAKGLLNAFNVKQIKEQESILKLGYMARGDVDFYPRFGNTYEWDTAAGQIVLEEAGCSMLNIHTMEPMEYGKQDFLNRGYVAFRNDLEPKVKNFFKQYKWNRGDSGRFD